MNSSNEQPASFSKLPPGKFKKWVFCLIALGIAFLPVVLLELVLVLVGWAPVTELEDPFIGLAGNQKLFAQSDDGSVFQIRPERSGFFQPASFLAVKPVDGFRVFVLGGSTVQGRPWETETAFPKWLEICLKANLPTRKVEVINCGGVSYASYRLTPVFREILEYQPDLVILCTGHNEFLEERTYAAEKRLSGLLVTLHRWFSVSRSYQFLRTQVLRIRKAPGNGPQSRLGESVVTRLDFENGLARFSKQSLQRDTVNRHFRFNVQAMISSALSHEIPLMVIAPPVNQKDCFPFKPVDDWTTESMSQFSDFSLQDFESGMKQYKDNADFCFCYGNQLDRMGRYQEAKEQWNRAIDNDLCPLRMTRELRSSLATLAKRERDRASDPSSILFLDLQAELEKVAKNSIIGNELLVDHVHPDIATHQVIARWITKSLQQNGLIRYSPTWEIDIVDGFENQIKSLDFAYYQRGKDRLESVLRWSRGKAVNALSGDPPTTGQ